MVWEGFLFANPLCPIPLPKPLSLAMPERGQNEGSRLVQRQIAVTHSVLKKVPVSRRLYMSTKRGLAVRSAEGCSVTSIAPIVMDQLQKCFCNDPFPRPHK